MKRIILAVAICGMTASTIHCWTPPALAQSYSKKNEIRNLESQAQRHCEAAALIHTAESEAMEDGRKDDAETFRITKERELAKCREIHALAATKKAALADEIRRAEAEKVER